MVKWCTLPIGKIGFRHMPEPLEVFERNIRDGDMVVDIGCGDGFVYEYLRKRRKRLNFLGSDVNDVMIEYCQKRYPDQKWQCRNAINFENIDRKPDVVTYHGVFHHMERFNDIWKSLKSSLENAEIVMLYEPIQSDNLILKLIKSVYWKITDGGKFYLTLEDFHELFKSCGAEVIYEDYSRPLRQIYVAVLRKRKDKY